MVQYNGRATVEMVQAACHDDIISNFDCINEEMKEIGAAPGGPSQPGPPAFLQMCGVTRPPTDCESGKQLIQKLGGCLGTGRGRHVANKLKRRLAV